FPSEPPPPERAPETQTAPEGPAKPELPKPSARTDGGAPGTTAPGTTAPGTTEIGAPTVGERGQERLETFELDTFRAVFTSYGAALKSWELKGEKYRVEDGGQPRQLDLVRTQSEGLLPFRIGFEGLELVPEQSEWKVERKSDTEIAFTYDYEVEQNGVRKRLFELVKTYRLYPRDYLVELTVSVQNLDADSQNVAMVLSMFGYQDPAAKAGGGWMGNVDTSWKAACLSGDELDVAGLDDLGEAPRQRAGNVRWAGLMQSYFLMAASPALDDKAQATCRLSLVPEQFGVMRADIVFPPFRVSAGDPPMTQSVTAYLGPKYLDALEGITAKIGRDPGFGEAIDLGWFGPLVRPLLWLLQLFYSLVGNWGVAIVLLTVVVKLVTLPWTTKSMRSMKQMAKLRPKIEALQKKHADNRERQQVEMMNLYKAHGVNPLAGCLPMLLQMPIWFALYRMLMTAGELYRAPLIPGWIHDLTAADPFYILPIILVGMMFLQAKLSPTTADSAQQKIMMYGLPLTFGFFSFFLPSGLTLYILTNTILTTLHQLWMNRTDPSVQPAKSDAADTAKKAADAGTSRTGGARERRTSAETPRAKSAGTPPAGDEGESEEPASQDRGPRRSGSRRRGGKSRRR
ncbi:MAG TPA: membrane protein insertase YidC, partial [Haliangium sp.]|nr:membrane protein insertase YidC [Haliangium sp.]